jgi:hypothetical protein
MSLPYVSLRVIGVLSHAVAMSVALMLPAVAHAQDKSGVTKCTAPYGTIAINEPSQDSLNYLYGYRLGSPSSLLRVFAQESNCFIVVERGKGMDNMKTERALAGSGELQEGQNIGKGQMIAADYMMTPSIQGTNNNAGGVGAAVGGRLGGRLGGVVGGGLKTKEAQTSITVASVRTGVQVAAAEGAATKRDFGLGGFGVAGALLGGGAYTNTAEGKMIAASLLDNFNAVIAGIAKNPSVKAMSADRIAAVTGGAPDAGGGMNDGDVVRPKIDGVKILKTASESAEVVVTLKRSDDLVYLGETAGNFIKVAGSGGEGWVRKSLVAPK